MGRRDNRAQIAEEITRELEKATGITWEPNIYRGSTTIEYNADQYNIYVKFFVYEDALDSISIQKRSPTNISIDELYDLMDCINRICKRKHSLYFDLKEDREIYNFMDLIDIDEINTGNKFSEEASRDIVEKIDLTIKKGSLSVVNLNRMDRLDKHYREFLKDRDVLITKDNFAILFDND